MELPWFSYSTEQEGSEIPHFNYFSLCNAWMLQITASITFINIQFSLLLPNQESCPGINAKMGVQYYTCMNVLVLVLS